MKAMGEDFFDDTFLARWLANDLTSEELAKKLKLSLCIDTLE